ncbi:type VI secretion system baseplate subunit TssF [Phycisphaeraceae bacterium D3-23]
MTEQLLEYYNNELGYLRKLGAEFAQANPDVAPQLRIDATSAQDPYVERLIESFAYLNARTRLKLDDEFPEISDAMLGVLFPQYLAPMPSVAIAQFAIDPAQAGLAQGYKLPRGTELETERVDDTPCRFQTCFATHLLPINVAGASIATDAMVPAVNTLEPTPSVLQIQLRSFAPDPPMGKMDLRSLRFYIDGEPSVANAIYQMIFTKTVEVAIATGPSDKAPRVLGKAALKPVGFDESQMMLPPSTRTFQGYQLLSEYFAMPEKFRFFEIAGITPEAVQRLGPTAELYLYLTASPEALARSIDKETFKLGCTPIINLFKQRLVPFQLTPTQHRYPLVSDTRWPETQEVYSVDSVAGTLPSGESVPVRPFFSISHTDDAEGLFYQIARRTAGYANGGYDNGTELDLALVDLSQNPVSPENLTLSVQATCLNRDQPQRLPFGAGRPGIKPLAGGPLAPIRCLTPPTPTRRLALKGEALWRLISQLSLNHLSICDGPDGAAALREILSLYDYLGSPDRVARINAVESVKHHRVTARVGKGASASFCRGVEINVGCDENRFGDNGLYLFGAVLEQFLGRYASVNAFTRLVVSSRQHNLELFRWPARAADIQII